jgi:hypothetical protein
MDLQYAPLVLASASYSTMEGIIADVAKRERGGLFSRSADAKLDQCRSCAKRACNVGRIAHTADGYDCMGRALARTISTSAR